MYNRNEEVDVLLVAFIFKKGCQVLFITLKPNTVVPRPNMREHYWRASEASETPSIATYRKKCVYVTVLRKNGLIAGLAKIDFFPEMAYTKLRYCLSKI